MKEISAQELIKLMEFIPKELEIVDVRQRYEYCISHLINSKSIPLTEIEFRYEEIDCNKTVIVICRSGNRSKSAADFLCGLERFRKTQILNLADGLLAVAEQPLGSLAIVKC